MIAAWWSIRSTNSPVISRWPTAIASRCVTRSHCIIRQLLFRCPHAYRIIRPMRSLILSPDIWGACPRIRCVLLVPFSREKGCYSWSEAVGLLRSLIIYASYSVTESRCIWHVVHIMRRNSTPPASFAQFFLERSHGSEVPRLISNISLFIYFLFYFILFYFILFFI